MSKFGTPTSVFLRYGLAVLSVVAALFVKELLRAYFDPTPNSLFFCAVVLSSWVGGLGPGLLASSLSVVLIDYHFKSPYYTLELGAEDLPRMAVFFLSAASISWLSASQKRARESLRQARDELELKVQERTAELMRSVEQLTALSEVSQAISSTLDLQRVLEASTLEEIEASAASLVSVL